MTARRRVGFVSTNFHDHVVGRLFRCWPERLDPQRYERVVFAVGEVEDDATRRLAQGVDHYLRVRSLREAAAALRGAALDALIYPDHGLAPITQALAALRFAPFQAVGWGHPITTGHATIDAFLTSDWMEPSDGARHYTERLIRLPGLGTWFEPAPSPPGASEESDAAPLRMLCPQAAFKLSPRHDALFARILARVPDATLTLIPSRSEPVRAELELRLRRASERHGVDPQRIRCEPYLPEAEFLQRLGTYHLALDTLDWSGGVSTLAMLQHGLPIVTAPRGALRGHQTAGLLRAIGVEDAIACDEADYVERVATLAADGARRRAMRHRILAGWPTLARANDAFRLALDALIERETGTGAQAAHATAG